MLSLLPPELLRDIIAATVPHTFHSSTYQDRQDTLCSLSLVSKQFRAIAQPLLLEIVWVRSLEEIDHLFSCGGGGNDPAKSIRCAVIELEEQPDENPMDIPYILRNSYKTQSLLRKFSAVTMLTLVNDSGTTIDLAFLSSLQKLSFLQLSRGSWSLDRSSPLVKLKTLAFVDAGSEIMSTLFRSPTLPNLQHFALIGSSSISSLPANDLANLLPQLKSIYLKSSAWTGADADFLRVKANSTLINCRCSGLRRVFETHSQFVHIRIPELHSATWRNNLYGPLYIFLEELRKKDRSSPLKSIYLDSSLQPTLSLPLGIQSVVRDIVSVCQGRKIDVVFERVSQDYLIDSPFSLEFSERQRTVRRNEG